MQVCGTLQEGLMLISKRLGDQFGVFCQFFLESELIGYIISPILHKKKAYR